MLQGLDDLAIDHDVSRALAQDEHQVPFVAGAEQGVAGGNRDDRRVVRKEFEENHVRHFPGG